MEEFLSLNLSEETLRSLDVYLKQTLKIKMTSKEILETSLKHLFITRDVNNYVITIDTNFFLPQTNYRVNDLVNLITYGNLEVCGYDVMVKLANYIRGNINLLFTEYSITGEEE
jgi:hypothetical protein